MKTTAIVILLTCTLLGAGCSRSSTQSDKATPNTQLQSDSERLQQATAKAAEERRKEEERREAEKATSPLPASPSPASTAP